jgi:hypothetical protein
VYYITEDYVVARFEVDIDYTFGEDETKLPDLQKYRPGRELFVRRQVDALHSDTAVNVTPLWQVTYTFHSLILILTHLVASILCELNSNSMSIAVGCTGTPGILPRRK